MPILQLMRMFRKARSRKVVGLAAVGVILALSIVGNALCFYLFDGPQKPELTFADALWYSVISITTIGYGDYSATSTGARLGTVVCIAGLGLLAFSAFAGLLIDWFTELALKGDRGMGSAHACDHVIIVHFPSAARVAQLIDEIQSDPEHARREIVIVSDQIEKLPFVRPNVLFVHGSSLSAETYQRAQTEQSRQAIVLATSY